MTTENDEHKTLICQKRHTKNKQLNCIRTATK